MNYSIYPCILVGAAIGSLIAIYMGIDPTNVVPIFIGIVVGLIAAFMLKSRSQKESDEERG